MSDFIFTDKRKIGKTEWVEVKPEPEVVESVPVPFLLPADLKPKPEIEIYPQTLARCHYYWLMAETQAIIAEGKVKAEAE